MFLQMWNVNERKPVYEPFLSAPIPDFGKAKGYVIPYGDCPLDGMKVGEAVYMDILNRSQRYVHIMTPYLILDGEMETALRFAAQRGVDVTLILPGIPDKQMPYALAKTHYPSLLEAGVSIYEYTPGFVHAKVFVSDDARPSWAPSTSITAAYTITLNAPPIWTALPVSATLKPIFRRH